MMEESARDRRGFTLVELLVVMGIFGIIMGAVYSIYLTHQRNAYSQEELVDVQQNLRTGMDRITRDLRMAGTLVPLGINPLASGTPLNNYSTSVQINTASAPGKLARITRTTAVTTTFANYSATVDSPESVDGLASLTGDGAVNLRIIRPIGMGNPVAPDPFLTLISQNRSKPGVTMQRPTGNLTIATGDIIAAAGPSPITGLQYDTITYSLAPCDATTTLRCLQRRVNNAAAETIAGPFSSLRFSYLNNDGKTENNTPNDSDKFNEGVAAIRGVRITLTGATTTTVRLSGGARTRQLTSMVTIRNRR